MKKIFMVLFAVVVVLFVACGNKESTTSVKAKELVEIAKLSGDLQSMIELNAEQLETYYGIKANGVDDYCVYIPLKNTKCDEIAVVKVSSDKINNIKERFEARGKNLETQWENNNPEQYKLVKDRIINSSGNFAYMIIGEEADKMEAALQDKLK